MLCTNTDLLYNMPINFHLLAIWHCLNLVHFFSDILQKSICKNHQPTDSLMLIDQNLLYKNDAIFHDNVGVYPYKDCHRYFKRCQKSALLALQWSASKRICRFEWINHLPLSINNGLSALCKGIKSKKPSNCVKKLLR